MHGHWHATFLCIIADLLRFQDTSRRCQVRVHHVYGASIDKPLELLFEVDILARQGWQCTILRVDRDQDFPRLADPMRIFSKE